MFFSVPKNQKPNFFVLIFIVDKIQKQRRDSINSMASSLFELGQPTITKIKTKQNYLLFGF